MNDFYHGRWYFKCSVVLLYFMKLVSLIIVAFLSAFFVMGQEVERFNERRRELDKRLMVGLGSWAGVNMIGSGIAWASLPQGEARSFHQMNVMWNTVNLGLAIPGFIKAKRVEDKLPFGQTLEEHYKTEKVFLFNSGLDVAYMTSGLLLRSMADNKPENAYQLRGFGNGLLLQGGFLMVFDLTAYVLHRNHLNKSGIIEDLSLGMTESGFSLTLYL